MFYSPLRYPGGKSKLSAFVLETIKLNSLHQGVYVEPFAGGAAIAWFLLLENHVQKVYINDLDPYIHAFWHCVLNETEEFCKLIENATVNMDAWHKQRDIFRSNKTTLLERGFATFFLNRTNRSGIMKAGVIGGLNQEGNYKLDCRYNKKALIDKIRNISLQKTRIVLTNLDAVEFIDETLPEIGMKCLVNIDPPYYVKGKGLYRNFFSHEDHIRLHTCIGNIKQPWIVTYDDTPEINDIYSEYIPKSFGLTYTAQIKKRGAEVIMHKPNMKRCSYKPDITFKELAKNKAKETTS